ncbi:hypothetical protein GN244_ATG08505 [Phytophthora infestans]|uniref:Uncharacterized protein n=1 Tax=Phytophthora infestans TaxID=4787 RepID=A0A833TE21_PHYIN|nr:hypothetical protein GN244_ATG08505 [Phytophthora infestans]KAF4132363.1 hypothetical protein GN958_ATG18480 [Phytophthora infestans]
MFMSSFLRLPGVREALSARRQVVLRREAIPREPEVIVFDDDDDDPWTANVDKVNVSRNPEKIIFPTLFLLTGQTSDYALELQLWSNRNKIVISLVEMCNCVNVVVTGVAKRTIEEGEEGAVDYVDPWFDCVCDAPNCRD